MAGQSKDDLDAWNEAAATYASQVGAADDTIYRRFEPFIWRHLGEQLEGRRVLDRGCGHGWLAASIAERGAEVVGIDGSSALLEIGRERHPGFVLEEADLVDGLPPEIEGTEFDRVVAHMVVMDLPELERLGASLGRCVGPSGTVLLTLLHPAFFMQAPVEDPERGERYRKVRGYLQHEEWWIESFGGHRHYHRPLSFYIDWMVRHGFALVELFEPPVPVGKPEDEWTDTTAGSPRSPRWWEWRSRDGAIIPDTALHSVSHPFCTLGCMTDLASVKEMRQQLAGVDPSSLSAREAEDLLGATVGVINAAWALAGRATRRVGETDAFRRCGDRSEAHHLGRVAGVGLGAAETALEVTAATDTLDATGRAFRHGELSVRQTSAVCSAALADRRAENRLLRLAKTRGINQLEEECARVRAAAAPDDEAERHRRARRERGAWKHTNRDGSAEIRFRSSTDDVAEAWAVIAAFARRLVGQGAGSGEGERPSFDQHNADGFLDMCRVAAGGTILTPANEPTLPIDGLQPCRPAANPKKIIVRVDLAALLRGYPADGEVCDIPGYGPIPVTAVRDMLASGNPVLAAVVTNGVNVATVAHLGRDPSAHQQTAMEWLDPRCRAEGCDRTVGLERDHRIDWSPTQVTLLGWMEWLCTHHHDLKTTQGWRLVHGQGVRPFVPPDDPRHPNHSPPPRPGGDPRGDTDQGEAGS